VGVDPFEDVEVVAKQGDTTVMRWFMNSGDGTFDFSSEPDCLEFRRRGPTGQRSPALRICGEDLRTRQFRASDADEYGWISCHDGVIGKPAAAVGGRRPTADEPDAGSEMAEPEPSGADAGGSPLPEHVTSCSTMPGVRHSPLALLLLFALIALRRR
jgi:hypothetical protein